MRRLLTAAAAWGALVVTALAPATAAHASGGGLSAINHIVVIYQENHSFDNLFGNWPAVNGQTGEGRSAAPAAQTTQVDQSGTALACLLQNDVNLDTTFGSHYSNATLTGALAPSCNSTGAANQYANAASSSTGNPFQVTSPYNSAFTNAPFNINSFIPASALTCAAPGAAPKHGVVAGAAGSQAGGCTEDIVHRFYQEQYQLDGGKQDRYTVGSDAVGLTQGYYDSTQLPLEQYLTGAGAPTYVINDHFFQGAFGGSYANHQMLVSATLPAWDPTVPAALGGAPVPASQRSQLDANGFPNSTYPLYTPLSGTTYVDQNLAQACPGVGGLLCGTNAINTIQPASQPHAPATNALPEINDATTPNIGDLLSSNSVDWGWYSGGWDNAAGVSTGPGWTNGGGATGTPCTDPNAATGAKIPYCPDKLFQFHHQAFNYYQNYAETVPGTPSSRTAAGQAHLLDETDLFTETSGGVDLATYTQNGSLKPVTFIKAIGEENEHPGYASTTNGESHLVKLIKAIEAGPNAADTMIVVTYDEFGGQWDHVPPPGQGSTTSGPHDLMGPGTRIPAVTIIPSALGTSGVDKTVHDTSAILTTIENRFLPGGASQTHLTARDAAEADLSSVFPGAGPVVPEVPMTVLLPFTALGLGGLAMILTQRRRSRPAIA